MDEGLGLGCSESWHTTQFILDHLYSIKNGLFLCYLRLSRDL